MQKPQSTPAVSPSVESKLWYTFCGLVLAVLMWLGVYFGLHGVFQSFEPPIKQLRGSDFVNDKEMKKTILGCHTMHSIKALYLAPCDDDALRNSRAKDYNENMEVTISNRNFDKATLPANFAFLFAWPIAAVYLFRRAKRRSLASTVKPGAGEL